MNDLLIDTCAAIWMLSDQPLHNGAETRIAEAIDRGGRVMVSPVSAWEVGMLVSRGRLSLPFSPHEWYARLVGLPEIGVAGLTPRIMIDSHFLPGDPPRDPMDRIYLSTARTDGMTIVTRDRAILDYAEKGHVMAMAC